MKKRITIKDKKVRQIIQGIDNRDAEARFLLLLRLAVKKK
jgi:hypothetical protein